MRLNTKGASLATERHQKASVDTSETAKVVSFIDLAGHERYLRTTVYGLTAHEPDYVMVVVGANHGITRMTKVSKCMRQPHAWVGGWLVNQCSRSWHIEPRAQLCVEPRAEPRRVLYATPVPFQEHVGMAIALNVPLFVVVTKVDLCPEPVMKETMKQLSRLLKAASRDLTQGQTLNFAC